VSEHDVDWLAARLREELRPRRGLSEGDSPIDVLDFVWPARIQAERFWPVTVDRPLLYRPSTWGRIRGTLLAPPKLFLRKLMRWYVEPAFAQQRDFNASVLSALDELNARVDALAEELVRQRRAGEL
jgi:hypothetical protein